MNSTRLSDPRQINQRLCNAVLSVRRFRLHPLCVHSDGMHRGSVPLRLTSFGLCSDVTSSNQRPQSSVLPSCPNRLQCLFCCINLPLTETLFSFIVCLMQQNISSMKTSRCLLFTPVPPGSIINSRTIA